MEQMNFAGSRLKSLLEPHEPHLGAILDEVLRIAADSTYQLRFSFAANGLRELLREYFSEVAPDDEIKTACWYEVSDAKDGVGRRQRVQFAIYQFIHPDELPTEFVSDADALAGGLLKAIDKLSKFIHITAEVLSTPTSVGEAALTAALDGFVELFEMIARARQHVRSRLEGEISMALDELFISEFFDNIDQLSTHSRPQGASDVEFEIDSIVADEVSFSGTGSVDVDLQYGSDGDCRRGDGVEFSDSYPFQFSGTTSPDNLRRVKVDPRDVDVDTSSFYE